MRLTEGTHYEKLVFEAGKLTGEYYCADVFDGKATVLRRTHPDIAIDDLILEGVQLRKIRTVANRTAKRLERREKQL